MYHKSNLYLERSLQSIPLASQTFSKSITQYPKGVSPLFIAKGKGAKVWDIDGNEYIDFVNSLAAVTIGYCDDDINQAITTQLGNGISFTLPHTLETEVAEMLIELIPCAQKVRFGKNGTDATSAAIRLARAYTGREHIAVCGYHGWQDWYIGSTSRDLGVPQSVKELTHTFTYNDIASLEQVCSQYNLAAVIIEPMNVAYPKDRFLHKVKELTHKHGGLLIFDETITGFRFDIGGAQTLFGVTPDLATFGKGMANGMPLSAVVGSNEIMQKMEDIFFSGTFGGETLSLASAKATIHKYRELNVVNHLTDIGEYLLSKLNTLISHHNLTDVFYTSGHPTWSFLHIKSQEQYSMYEIKTLFLQEMFKRGILTLGAHNLSYAHTKADINTLICVYDKVLPMIAQSIQEETLLDRIKGDILNPLFKVR